MSNLNHYVRQLRPRTESYIDPVDRVQNILTEAKMDATKFEGNLLIAMGAKPTQVGSYNPDKESKELASSIVQQMIKSKINILESSLNQLPEQQQDYVKYTRNFNLKDKI